MHWTLRVARIVLLGICALVCLLLVGYVFFLVGAMLFYGMPAGTP